MHVCSPRWGLHWRRPHAFLDCLQVWAQLPEDKVSFLRSEIDFFDELISISGKLYAVPRDQRKAAAVKLARKVELPNLVHSPDSRAADLMIS